MYDVFNGHQYIGSDLMMAMAVALWFALCGLVFRFGLTTIGRLAEFDNIFMQCVHIIVYTYIKNCHFKWTVCVSGVDKKTWTIIL